MILSLPRPLLIALQFLTRLPVRSAGQWLPSDIGRSLLWYPLVGLLLGAILVAVASVLDGSPTLLASALLLTLWVGLTGALHLDGLADSTDAWLGGFGDRERTLDIMKDPRSGPAGVVALILVLLLKFAALNALLEQGELITLIIACVAARAAMLGLFLSTPYVRPGGLGDALATHLPRRSAKLVLVVSAALLMLFGGFVAVIAVAALLWWARRLMQTRIGGCTGDTAGALLETAEAVALLVISL